MKTKNLIFYLFLIFFFIISGCSQKQDSENKIKIYTTLYPLEQFTRWLIPDAEIYTLIPESADPHHFEPSLRDIQRLYTADIIIYTGDTDIDRWMDRIKNEITQKGVKMLRIQDHVTLKKYSSCNEFDPHIWLDPLSVIEIIKLIKSAIQEISPEQKQIYEKNFLDYESKLRELDRDYKQALSSCKKRDVIITHEFLNYTGQRYGFNCHFIVHEPDEEPSIKKIKEFKNFIKKNSIHYIVSELEGEKIARMLSEETGAKVLQFNTFHKKSDKDYLEAMQENLKILSEALNCK